MFQVIGCRLGPLLFWILVTKVEMPKSLLKSFVEARLSLQGGRLFGYLMCLFQ